LDDAPNCNSFTINNKCMSYKAIIRIDIDHRLFLRDPESSELGRNIVGSSIELMEKLGYEEFTFRKLAELIQSTEASVYRYFRNKHQLLSYLVSWYCGWLEYQIDILTNNIPEGEEQFRTAIRVLSENSRYDPTYSHINEELLHRIVMSEGTKTFLAHAVVERDNEGYYNSFKSLILRIADLILDINPHYPTPRALANMLLINAMHQQYFALHLPSITEFSAAQAPDAALAEFLVKSALRIIRDSG
jgi:AcrR family transcriptional regulator